MDVQVSSRDPCFEVALRCLAAEGDGYGLHEANDGGLLAAIMAAGFKGTFFYSKGRPLFEIFRAVFLNDLLWQVNSVGSNLEFRWQFHGLMLGILTGVVPWRAPLLT